MTIKEPHTAGCPGAADKIYNLFLAVLINLCSANSVRISLFYSKVCFQKIKLEYIHSILLGTRYSPGGIPVFYSFTLEERTKFTF